MVMTFDYYYGAQAEQFNFIRIPKAMIVDPMFADLSVNAKSEFDVWMAHDSGCGSWARISL